MIVCSPRIIITLDAAPVNKGAVVIRQGSITAAGPADKLVRKYPGHRVVHVADSVLLPGLINLHTHLELPPLLDIIRSKTFPDWVLNLVRIKKELTNNDYALATRQNINTLMSTGTTTVAEICTHNISPALLRESGLRAVIFHELISMHPAAPFPRLPSLVSRPSTLIRTGVSPHAPHTVSKQALLALNKIAAQKSFPLCMHVAESKDELRLLQGKGNGFEKLYKAAGWDQAWAPSADSPFEYLSGLGLLGPKFLVVHSVQATDRDIHILTRSHAPVAHCPRSNTETGVGRMRLKKILDAGITVGLGTDSLASSPSLNMWDEMRYALQVHRRDGITAQDIFRLATIGGAKALGMDKEIGSLEPGKRADIIAVPLPSKNTGDLYSDLLRETKSCIINMVDGKLLKENN